MVNPTTFAPVGASTSSDAEVFVLKVLNSMEQGILVWSAEGVCTLFNQRIFTVLELPASGLAVGTKRVEFLQAAVARNELTQASVDAAEEKFAAGHPFTFDRMMPSGRVVSTSARPESSGGFIVTFTDVTAARRNQERLEKVSQAAQVAQRQAMQALNLENNRKNETRLLSELGEWLQSSKSLTELYNVIESFMAKMFVGSSGELYVYSNSRDVLDSACSWNMDTSHDHIDADDCWALRRGRIYKYGKGLVDFKCSHVTGEFAVECEKPEPEKPSRYVCIPIIAHGDTVGMLHIRFVIGESGEIEDKFYAFALRCAEQISLAIANVKLRDELRNQSTRDSLTNIHNRRYFLDRFRTEIQNSVRRETQLAVLSIDADHFKRFNDNHGHDAGDIVLRLLADTMAAEFEEPAVPARIGGEEFAVLLPGASISDARIAGEAIRKRIEGLSAYCAGKRLPQVTISVGVASYPSEGNTPLELMKAADKALYRSKDSGRNCVSLPAGSGENTTVSVN